MTLLEFWTDVGAAGALRAERHRCKARCEKFTDENSILPTFVQNLQTKPNRQLEKIYDVWKGAAACWHETLMMRVIESISTLKTFLETTLSMIGYN